MKVDQKVLEAYLVKHTTGETLLLQELNRHTHLEMVYPRMLSGPIMGRFLSMISHMIKPFSILEVGTFTGYSAIYLAEGLQKNGKLHTIEINEELIKDNILRFEKSGNANKIVQHVGNAFDIIPNLGIQFDLVFLDADKVHYPDYFELVMKYMNMGAFLLADNVLWSGKVLSTIDTNLDKDALAIKRFNDIVQNDDRVENVILNVRDGIMLIRKVI